MTTTRPLTHPLSQAPPDRWPLFVAAGVVALVFFVTEHDLTMSTRAGFAYTADELGALAHGGDTPRRVAYLSLAALGGAFVLLSLRRPFQIDGLLAPLIVGFLLWAGASVLWSVEPGMTVRRLLVLGCCAVGAFGLALRFPGRDLIRLVAFVTFAYAALGIVTEAALGTFRPWAGDYRFAGTVHPNTQAGYLAALCLASFTLLMGAQPRIPQPRKWDYGKWGYAGLLATGLVLLALTRSRTSAVGTLTTLAVLWSVRSSASSVVIRGLFAAGALCLILALGALFGGRAMEDRVASVLLLGRAQDVASLTGRLPLWNELFGYIDQRPLHGHGFDTFWTEEHVQAVSATQEWGIHEAHSSYLEIVLNLGLVGLVLGGLAVLIALAITAGRYRQTRRPEFGFFFGLYLYGAINGFTESGMTMPNFVPFVAAAGLLRLAFLPVGAGASGVHRVRNNSRGVSKDAIPHSARTQAPCAT